MTEQNVMTPVGDTLLAMMINNMVEVSGASVPITITTGGLIATGMAISYRQWAEGMRQLIAEAVHHELPAFGDLPPMLPDHIHLQNVRFLYASDQVDVKNGLWRVRLDRVDAWAFGSMGTA